MSSQSVCVIFHLLVRVMLRKTFFNHVFFPIHIYLVVFFLLRGEAKDVEIGDMILGKALHIHSFKWAPKCKHTQTHTCHKREKTALSES